MPRRGRVAPACAVVLAVALALSGCDGEPAPGAGDRREDRYLSAVDGLCGALTSAQDPDAAQAAFLDRSHQALHEIAAEVQGRDPAPAAALLEAKARVETDFREGATPSALERDLQTLIGATVDALRTLGIESPGCA